ncbi:MAG: D-sedoheptulose 7-phosphate isomerase [bacterium]|jgi:D-sedoheptulose 7-phosphate isomerase
MDHQDFFTNYFEVMKQGIQSVNMDDLEKSARLIRNTSKAGKKVMIVGNGGSAGIASHMAVDFTKAAKIRATCFNDSNLITCFANDYGYEYWVEKALEAYADEGDLVVLISSSGTSINMINAANKAKEMGITVITLSGFSEDNPLKKLGDVNFWVNSKGYNIIEMSHHIWLVAIVDFLIGKIEYSA